MRLFNGSLETLLLRKLSCLCTQDHSTVTLKLPELDQGPFAAVPHTHIGFPYGLGLSFPMAVSQTSKFLKKFNLGAMTKQLNNNTSWFLWGGTPKKEHLGSHPLSLSTKVRASLLLLCFRVFSLLAGPQVPRALVLQSQQVTASGPRLPQSSAYSSTAAAPNLAAQKRFFNTHSPLTVPVFPPLHTEEALLSLKMSPIEEARRAETSVICVRQVGL